LYHATFPPAYLEYIHDTDYKNQAITGTVTLSSTKLYDFYDPMERGEWLYIVIALIEYLRSGENKVGFLNKSLERNKLHKNPADVVDGKDRERDTKQVSSATTGGNVAGGGVAGGDIVAVPKAGRKRRMDSERPGWDIKVPRKR
jgi:hypothetical protein